MIMNIAIQSNGLEQGMYAAIDRTADAPNAR
jgi:hypothetical protein